MARTQLRSVHVQSHHQRSKRKNLEEGEGQDDNEEAKSVWHSLRALHEAPNMMSGLAFKAPHAFLHQGV